jgi:hypothetical protein
MLDFDIYKPYVGDKILISRILEVEKYNAQYLDYIREFAAGPLVPEIMHAEIQRLHNFIRDAVAADSHAIFSYDDFERSLEQMVEPKFPVFGSGIIGLKTFVTERIASVEAQLAGEKEGYKVERIQMERGTTPQHEAARQKLEQLK